MNFTSWANPSPLFVEIGPDCFRARRGRENVEIALEHLPSGRLTAQSKERTLAALKKLLDPKGWLPRPRAWCAISSRGVSLRRLSLPGGTAEEFQKRLLLQIESEFPLPPEELAWGWQPLDRQAPINGAVNPQGVLVAAVKKEFVADYDEILRAGGADPAFTLAALARWNCWGRPADSFALLDVGARQSELMIFENGAPINSRIIFWDVKNVSSQAGAGLETLAQNLKPSLRGLRLCVTGQGREFADRLASCLGGACRCEALAATQSGGSSAAISGLEEYAAAGQPPPMVIKLKPDSAASANWSGVDWKTWGVRAGALAATVLALPYAEAWLLKPHLEKRVAEFKTEAGRLKVIDRELDFLRDLKLSQPPYLDLLYVFSKSAPPGTHFDSLSMNGHGEVSLHSAFHDGQQVADFRNKLIASGFFTNVVVEEQIPTPDHQKVNVRMHAQEKTAIELQAAVARLAADTSKSEGKTGATNNTSPAISAPSLSRKETP